MLWDVIYSDLLVFRLIVVESSKPGPFVYTVGLTIINVLLCIFQQNQQINLHNIDLSLTVDNVTH